MHTSCHTHQSPGARTLLCAVCYQVLSVLRAFQRVVAKDKMASALEMFEREVRAQMISADLLTFGGAFRAALPVLRQFLNLSHSPAAPAPGGPKAEASEDSEVAKLKRVMENKDKQIANLKRTNAGGGRYNNNNNWRGNNNYNNWRGNNGNNYNNNQGGNNNPNNNANNRNRNTNANNNGGNNNNRVGNGGNGGGRNAPNANNSSWGTSDGTKGPSGYDRMMGGNPNNPETCPDWRNNVCHMRRNFCDRKHSN